MTIQAWGAFFLIAYVLSLAIIVWYARRQTDDRTIQDFYLATGKPLGLGVLIFTFSATLFSAFFMVGLPGFIYTHGIGTWPYVIFGDVLGMLGLFYVGRQFVRRRAEFGRELSPLEMICPSREAKLAFVIVTTVYILPYLSVQISGVGRLVESASGGAIPLAAAAAGTLLIIYLYSLFAGIRGIAYSDTLQGLLLIGSAWIVGGYIAFGQHDGPVALLRVAVQDAPMLMDVPGPRGLFTVGALVTSCVLFASLPITQPQFLTRYLVIESKGAERYLAGIALGMGALIAVGAFAVIPVGLNGALAFPGLSSGDELLGRSLAEYFPSWFGALFTVGVLAAAMSTADSILFSLGQMFGHDIYDEFIAGERNAVHSLIATKTFILGVAVVALVLGLSSSELIVRLSALSFAGMLHLAPVVIGSLWAKDPWRHSSTWSIVTGATAFIGFQSYNPLQFAGLGPAIAACIVSAVVFAATMGLANAEEATTPQE